MKSFNQLFDKAMNAAKDTTKPKAKRMRKGSYKPPALKQYEMSEIKGLGPFTITDIGDENIYFTLRDKSTGYCKVEGMPTKVAAKWVKTLRGVTNKAGALGVSKKKLKQEADFDDEDSVLREFAEAEDIDPLLANIKESHLSGFGAGTFYEIDFGGNKSYVVAADEDAARDLALKVVEQDLEEDPSMFNRSFIEGHINIDHLRDALFDDAKEMISEDFTGEAERNPIDFMKEHDIEIPEPTSSQMYQAAVDSGADNDKEIDEYLDNLKGEADAEDRWLEMGEEPEVSVEDIDVAAHDAAADRVKDPMAYLEDIYGKEDAVKQAIEIAGIDIEAAAEEAVDTDGWQHFLARYDGNSNETDAGFVYWREN